MAAPVPTIEVTHHRDAPRIRRPDREANALDTVDRHQLGAERPPQMAMITLGKQIDVHFAELRPEAVRVLGDLLTTGPADAQQVGLRVGQTDEEQSRHLPLLHAAQCSAPRTVEHLDTECVWQVGTNHQPIAVGVRAQDGERIAMLGADQRVDLGIAGQQVFSGHGHGRTITHWTLLCKAVEPALPGPARGPTARRADSQPRRPLRTRSSRG